MIVILDNEIKSGISIRTLLYTDAGELVGNRIVTKNAGTVLCEAGSVAMQAGFTNIKQLTPDGTWVDC